MIVKLKTKMFREGCDAEVGTYGKWHSCKRVPVIQRSVVITAVILIIPSMLMGVNCG